MNLSVGLILPKDILLFLLECVFSLCRYVGEGYSTAQEAMEDAMLSLYKQSTNFQPLSELAVGQLVAVKGENGDDLTRAQVTEVTNNIIKVTSLLDRLIV